MLEKNQHLIEWSELSLNINAISLLEKNQHLIEFYNLSFNINAISILEQNQKEIDYINISLNPSIFELDYKEMKINNQEIEEELIKEIMKPSRLFKMIEKYGEDYLELLFD